MPYWGIFPSFSHGGDCSLTYPLQFPSLGRDILYSPHWPLFLSSSSIWALSGALFETRRVPFSHFQRIEICSGMPHWGIPPSLSSSDVLQIFLTTQSISWSLRVIILGHTLLALFYWVIHPSLWVCHVSCWFHNRQTHLSIFASCHLV